MKIYMMLQEKIGLANKNRKLQINICERIILK
jgi:hypothetical protein